MQNNELTWRFPSNNYGNEIGIDSTDVETFMKDPISALAREIGQNSIDAQSDKEIPVKLEFKTFTLNRKEIPGIERLAAEINNCYEYKKNYDKEEKPLRFMLQEINKDKITCLRISDFNTKGLEGVLTNDKNSPFYLITKGSGVSNKEGTTGGSKGIGKYATFVNSMTNTVFYSTYTINEEKGYLGVSKLRSAPINIQDPDLLTQGIGFFSKSIKNEANSGEINLDKSFIRDTYGTDIYIIGFDDTQNWENEIILKILESFMGAIILNGFEVKVGNQIVNKSTLQQLMDSKELFINSSKKLVQEIKSQYELLNDIEVSTKQVDIYNFGSITIKVKKYNATNDEFAMKRNVYIRYPYMRIKHKTGFSYLPYSAICLIHNDEINKKLRTIENAQHTDWELNRLNNYKEEKKLTKSIIKRIDEEVNLFIREVLMEEHSESTDMEGAGDYLPSVNDGNSVKDDKEINEIRNITSPKKVKIKNNQKSFSDDDYETFDFNKGDLESNDEDARDINGNGINNPSDGTHYIDGNMGIGEGENQNLKKIGLTGMKYKNIVINKKEGIYQVLFKSLYSEDNCDIEIKLFGEGNEKFRLNIIEAKINDNNCHIDNGKIVNFKLEKDTYYKIFYKVSQTELFSSEVIIYAYRK